MEVRDGKKKRTFDTSDRISTGKFIALILRHNPSVVGMSVDEHGWADVDELIKKLGITKAFLEEIVRLDNKGRFSFNDDRTLIRANQGHSIPVDVGLEEALPPDILYHGTGRSSFPPSRGRVLFRSHASMSISPPPVIRLSLSARGMEELSSFLSTRRG